VIQHPSEENILNKLIANKAFGKVGKLCGFELVVHRHMSRNNNTHLFVGKVIKKLAFCSNSTYLFLPMGGCLSGMAGVHPDQHLTMLEKMEKSALTAKILSIPAHRYKTFAPDNHVQGQDWEAMNVLELGLSLDLSSMNTFYSLFCMADKDGSKSINVDEFLEFLKIEKSKFNKRLFGIFDANSSGEVDFLEFVCAIWNISTWEADKLSKLMFRIYDSDNSGCLDVEECTKMISDVFENRDDKTEEKILLESLMKKAVPGMYKGERVIREKHFVKWEKGHKEVVHPLYCVYLLVRNKIMGSDYWDVIGVEARKTIMGSILQLNRDFMGEPDVAVAVEDALRHTDGYREQNLIRIQHEEMWNGTAEKEIPEVASAKERIASIKFLREKRREKFEEFREKCATVESRGDPVSLILKLSNRNFMDVTRQKFEDSWSTGLSTLQSKTYDREGRLNAVHSKPGKEHKYFRTKTLNSVKKELRDNSERSFSTTGGGTKTWLEQQVVRRKDQKRKIAKARRKGNIATYSSSDSSDYEHDSNDKLEKKKYPSMSSDSDAESESESDTERQNEIAEGYIHAPESSRQVARKGQYKLQNRKVSTMEWRHRVVKRLKNNRDGVKDPAEKPYRYTQKKRRVRKKILKL